MAAFLENCVAGPNAAATVLLGIVLLYWVTMIFTGFGFDGFDIDVDVDADVEIDVLSFGGVALKWFNIGRVPLMIWLTIFALSFWVISISLRLPEGELSLWYMALLVLRNGAIALIPTKLLSQPLAGRFDVVEVNRSQELIGRTGVAMIEITPAKGQAEFSSSAAPLLLSVRTAQGVIEKDEEVTIVDFDSENCFLVERATRKDNREVGP